MKTFALACGGLLIAIGTAQAGYDAQVKDTRLDSKIQNSAIASGGTTKVYMSSVVGKADVSNLTANSKIMNSFIGGVGSTTVVMSSVMTTKP